MHQIHEYSSKQEVIAAVARSGWALGDANLALRADKKVVLTAVAQNGLALQCAVEELRADKEVVLTAVKQNSWALTYAAATLRMDKGFMLEAVAQNGMALCHASDEFTNDTSFFWQIWSIQKSKKNDGIRKDYIFEYLLKETTKILLGASLTTFSALLLSGFMTLLIPTLVVLIVGAISAIYPGSKLAEHGYGIFKAQSERATPSVKSALAI